MTMNVSDESRFDPAAFEAKAIQVADVLRALANERRLQILCVLMEMGEASVGALVARIGISQSALSQHLAKMREEGLVAFRRESQTLRYRIADRRIAELMGELYRLYCHEPKTPREGSTS
jgi:ArsR family transcriptional regulator, virulence genes transcriptional regulator